MAENTDKSTLSQTKAINRDSYTPAYAQLADSLKQGMAQGIFMPGDKLPSEAQMVEYYGVSPMTVRRAINNLIDRGYVIAEQGRGTFVKSFTMGEAVFKLRDLQDIFSDPERTSVRILETRIGRADEKTAAKLSLAPGSRTVNIRRVIYDEGIPILYHREFITYDPKKPIVEAELEVTALQQLFSGSGGAILKHGDISLDAVLLTEKEARVLQVDVPTAGFRIEHLFYDFDDQPVNWGWFIGPQGGLKFTTHVGLRSDQGAHNE